jgi:hypothetical protein
MSTAWGKGGWGDPPSRWLGRHGHFPLATRLSHVYTLHAVPDSNKAAVLLVFGEHAREIITCEVGLWLSRVLVGDTAELLAWPEMALAFEPLGVPASQVAATVEAWRHRALTNLVIKVGRPCMPQPYRPGGVTDWL